MRYWEGDCVVYNPLSGNTHILDLVSGEILKTIIARAACSEDLCQHLADFLEVPNNERVSQNVNDVLTALDELGLIEPVGGC